MARRTKRVWSRFGGGHWERQWKYTSVIDTAEDAGQMDVCLSLASV